MEIINLDKPNGFNATLKRLSEPLPTLKHLATSAQ